MSKKNGVNLREIGSRQQCVAALKAADVRLPLGLKRLLKAIGVLRDIIDDSNAKRHETLLLSYIFYDTIIV